MLHVYVKPVINYPVMYIYAIFIFHVILLNIYIHFGLYIVCFWWPFINNLNYTNTFLQNLAI